VLEESSRERRKLSNSLPLFDLVLKRRGSHLAVCRWLRKIAFPEGASFSRKTGQDAQRIIGKLYRGGIHPSREEMQ